MLWRGTEARPLTVQMKGVRWGMLDRKDEVRQRQVGDWKRVRAEMEMKGEREAASNTRSG